MNENSAETEISKMLLYRSFLAAMSCTAMSRQPRGKLMRTSMKLEKAGRCQLMPRTFALPGPTWR